MYVYKLIYEKQNKGIASMNIGYYSSYKKARKVKKKYQAIVPGFKDHSHGFKIRKIEVYRIEDGNTVIFDNVLTEGGERKSIRCSNILVRILRNEE